MESQGVFRSEQPQHTVTLPDYHIGKYPVTVGQYRAFIDAGGYAQRRETLQAKGDIDPDFLAQLHQMAGSLSWPRT